MLWARWACCALAWAGRSRHAPSPHAVFSYKGVPLQSNERLLLKVLPEFACGFTTGLRSVRADRMCWTSGDGNMYAGHPATSLQAEFNNQALCFVQIEFARVPKVVVEDVLRAMRQRHLGSPKWVLEHYADGREAVVGSRNGSSPVEHYAYRWDGAISYVSAKESTNRLEVVYSTEACDAAREQRKENAANGFILQKPQM